MPGPADIVWQSLARVRRETGRELTLAERAGFGWPACPEFLIKERHEGGLARPLTGWLTLSGALVALRRIKEER